MATLQPLFVHLVDVDSTILQEIRYAGSHNFVGRPIPGYNAAQCILTRAAAQALADAQREARAQGFSIKVYDGYRPRKAVKYFLRWCADPADACMQEEFFPHLPKDRIVAEGYLSANSMHCMGSAVDLTLVPLPVPTQPAFVAGQPLIDGSAAHALRFADNSIDMGTAFDYFGPLSHTANPGVGALAQGNRRFLEALMRKHGLVNYEKEWWHFSLANPPTREAFDFDINPRQ